ncbi:MAG TPA: GNAT family protein [Pyrinomonadaceae bacterium]|nr:GNAT family protein [Pyrinomonadaceae bacterium]
MEQTHFTQLETERLLLRRLHEADLAPLVDYLNDPLVARYQSWESYTEEQARELIERQQNLTPGVPGRWFNFALELKATGALAGHVALCVRADEARQAEIGFTLARSFQGRGLAAEAARRVLGFAFAELGLHRVVAITDTENAPSIALLEKLGMRREGHFLQNIWFKGNWGDEYLYALLREEWLRRQQQRDAQ